MNNEEIEAVEHVDFVYSALNRLLHWIRAFVITALAVTGFYIASPFLSPGESTSDLVYAEWVYWHVLFGFVLLTSGLLRMYLFFFSKDSNNERRSVKDILSLKSWIIQLKSYFFYW